MSCMHHNEKPSKPTQRADTRRISRLSWARMLSGAFLRVRFSPAIRLGPIEHPVHTMKHDSGSMSSRAWLGVGHYREARPSAVCREMRHRNS